MRNRSLVILALATIITAFPPSLLAGESTGDSNEQKMSTALPRTHLLTLTLEEAGETFAFSMPVASRHFSLSLGDKDIALRGRLLQSQGTQLLEFTLEFTQWVDSENNGKQRRGSTWNSSTHLRAGQPVEIATFLDGSISLRLDLLE